MIPFGISYIGLLFNACNFCNSFDDDISVITLAQDAPASARIYKVAVNPLTSGTRNRAAWRFWAWAR